MSTSSNSTWPWRRRNSTVAFLAFVAFAVLGSARGSAIADPTPAPSASASAVPGDSGDPCLQLSNLVSRPSFSTAACVVKRNSLLVQTGYSNMTTSGNGAGRFVTFPQENVSIGVAQNVEFDLNPPSLARLSQDTAAGLVKGDTDGSIGAKLQLAQTSKFTYGVNVLYTLQSGSDPFTGAGDGFLANLNGSYSLSPAVGIFASLGYNEQSAGTPEMPARYHDVQPSLGASLSLPQNFTVYAEGFNQSATAPGSTGTFGYDTGLQKDIGSRLQLDAEIFGYPGSHMGAHQHAAGFGAAYLFGP